MAKRRWKKIKTYWLLVNFILLALACLLPSDLEGFWGNLFAVCTTALIIQSYPLCILPMSLLIWGNPLTFMTFVAPISFATGYFQWFVIVPRLVKFIKKTFFSRDLQINLSVTAPSTKTLPDAKSDVSAQDWQKSWYDAQKRTPVERVFEKDES